MTEQQYVELPDTLTVREVRVDGQVLVTTMLNREIRKGELDQSYARRWKVELDLRNIKTMLGMEVLRCLTPQMVEKELWVHLLAYNLISLLMAQAARDADAQPRQLSFKHAARPLGTVACTSGGLEHRSRHILPATGATGSR